MAQQTQTKPLREVAEIISGFAFKSSEFSKHGIPIIRISNIINGDKVIILEESQPYYNGKIDDRIKNYIIKKFDILIALSGATTGKIGIYYEDKPSLLNQRIALIRRKDEKSNKYLYYFLQTKSQQILKEAYGGAQPNISPKNIEKYEIFYPSEQKQSLIVQAIETQFTRLDESVKLLNLVKAKLEVYRKAVLKKKLDGLKTKKLVDFCNNFKQDIVDGPFGSDLQRKDYLTQGIPVLKIQNVKENKIFLKKMDYISEQKYLELERHSFKPGDIVITKLGNPLGVAAIVPPEIKKGVIVADLVRIRAQKINTKYLCYALNSTKISNFINSKQKGTTRPRVKLSIVRELPIPIPENEIDQHNIVSEIESKFSVIDKIETVVEASLEKADKLRKSILKSAFEGKLVKVEEVKDV